MVNGAGINSTMMPTGNGMTVQASMSKASMTTPSTTSMVTGRLSHPLQKMALQPLPASMWSEGTLCCQVSRERRAVPKRDLLLPLSR